MKQSDQRAAARGRGPQSFGREEPEGAEDFTIRGGEAFHLVLHVEVHPDPESLAALHATIKATTRAGVLDGYAAAFAEMEATDGGEVQPAAPEGDGQDG